MSLNTLSLEGQLDSAGRITFSTNSLLIHNAIMNLIELIARDDEARRERSTLSFSGYNVNVGHRVHIVFKNADQLQAFWNEYTFVIMQLPFLETHYTGDQLVLKMRNGRIDMGIEDLNWKGQGIDLCVMASVHERTRRYTEYEKQVVFPSLMMRGSYCIYFVPNDTVTIQNNATNAE